MNKNLIILLLSGVCVLTIPVIAQQKEHNAAVQKEHGLVEWLDIEEALKRRAENPKPLLIDVYTEWCGWCKKMEKTTYSSPQVANYINKYFYPVQFDAESYDTINYLGKVYVNPGANKPGAPPAGSRARKSKHQLAGMFGIRSFPTTIFMNHEMKASIIAPGYLDAQNIAPFLVFYVEGVYNYSDIESFRTAYQNTYNPAFSVADTLKKEKGQVQWLGLQEAIDANESKPRKLFVHFVNSNCVSCKIMEHELYSNKVIADYLNQNYHCVRFDVNSKDNITLHGNVYGNTGNNTYHQFVVGAMNNKPKFPSVLIMNEENQVISPVPQYLTTELAEAMLNYFNAEAYKKQQFSEFLKAFESKLKAN